MNTVRDKKYLKELVVESSLPFPIDMLRYDTCFPRTSIETSAIYLSIENPSPDYTRRITLTKLAYKNDRCAEERWNSFGWKVILYDGKPPER